MWKILKRWFHPQYSKLYKAKFIDEGLELTSLGKQEMRDLQFIANKSELVKRAGNKLMQK